MIIWTFGQSVLFFPQISHTFRIKQNRQLFGDTRDGGDADRPSWAVRWFLRITGFDSNTFYLPPELYRHSNIISKKFEKVEILDFYSISYFYRKKEQKQEKEPLSSSPIKFSLDQIHISLQFHPKKFSKLWKAVLDSYSRVVILASDRVLLEFSILGRHISSNTR